MLDEPFSGLDPVNSQILKDVIRERIASGKIVIFSSHQMSYVEEFCEDVVIINLERLKAEGIEIDTYGSYEPSLNDIFVSCVGKEA